MQTVYDRFLSCCRPNNLLEQGRIKSPRSPTSESAEHEDSEETPKGPPSRTILTLLGSKCTSGPCNGLGLTDAIGSPHLQAIGGFLVIYGLATWWLGGSGVLIATIGASIWLVSTVTNAASEVVLAKDMNETRNAGYSLVGTGAVEVAASVGFATPLGWAVLALWDFYSLVATLTDCCTAKHSVPTYRTGYESE